MSVVRPIAVICSLISMVERIAAVGNFVPFGSLTLLFLVSSCLPVLVTLCTFLNKGSPMKTSMKISYRFVWGNILCKQTEQFICRLQESNQWSNWSPWSPCSRYLLSLHCSLFHLLALSLTGAAMAEFQCLFGNVSQKRSVWVARWKGMPLYICLID